MIVCYAGRGTLLYTTIIRKGGGRCTLLKNDDCVYTYKTTAPTRLLFDRTLKTDSYTREMAY